jgi:hypothetical protein
VNQKFFKKLQTMAIVEAALKSSSVPLFQRGKFRSRTLTPLWKRGEGEIFGRNEGELCRELLGQDTRLSANFVVPRMFLTFNLDLPYVANHAGFVVQFGVHLLEWEAK